jgi:hypothetical protein
VLALRLDRGGPTIELDIDVLAQQPEARTVTLRLDGVADVELSGLNEQNVLFDLKATRATTGGGTSTCSRRTASAVVFAAPRFASADQRPSGCITDHSGSQPFKRPDGRACLVGTSETVI